MRQSNPIQVGLTGGIGAGKTTVRKIFKVLGVPCYDADSRARFLMSHDSTIIEKVKSLFGPKAYNGSELNRKYISDIAFHTPEKLHSLNQLVHPRVGEDFSAWVSEQSSPYVIKEAALLVESGSYKELDSMIVVTAPEALRTQRVLERDKHRSLVDIQAIMEKQSSDEEKQAVAQYQVSNDGTQMVIPQVLKIDVAIRHLTD
ncbi:MAG: dephospho-CoA kinase [Cyclobacteriaceae bacterium]|nr:dephospho-CoA kinase [Cyclobacteriaceae bacterium HetDA_MAG_MS6]